MHLQTRQPSSASRRRQAAADQLSLQRLLHPCSRPHRLKAAGLVRASADSSSTPDASSSSSSKPPSAAAAASSNSLGDVLSEARQDLQHSLSLLKDAAGTAFVPGYRSNASTSTTSSSSSDTITSSSSSSRNGKPKITSRRLSTYSGLINAAQEAQDTQPVQSIPARLQRLLSGTFIRQAAGSSSSRAKAPFNAQLAAIQFELQAQADTTAAQQQQQEQQQPAAVQAEDTSTGVGVVIDVVPEATEHPGQQQQQQQQQVSGTTPSNQAAASSTATGSAVQPAEAASGGAAAAATADASFLATTQVLVLATWAVFLLQWWPALPELWLTVKEAGVVKALLALMFMFPDTPVTNALCLDLTAVQQGSWSGLFTSGLLHSGLAGTWLATKALQESANWLEAGLGPMPLLATALITSFCASVAHMVAGTTMVGLSGPGAVMGIYTTWLVLAAQHLRADVPIRVVALNAGLLLLLCLGLGMLQPAVGFASIFGGVIGGSLAVRLAVPVATALTWGLALPFLVSLFVLRLSVDAAKVLLLAMLAVVASGVQLVVGLTQSVRRL